MGLFKEFGAKMGRHVTPAPSGSAPAKPMRPRPYVGHVGLHVYSQQLTISTF